MLVVDSVLNDNILYYKGIKTESIAWLLVNENGTMLVKRIGNKKYSYLRKKTDNGKTKDIYIGPAQSQKHKFLQGVLESRKREIKNLREAKYALKRLGHRNMNYEDFPEILSELISAMSELGLFDDCLELIGSWCFKVYQNYLGVEYYPLKTVDVDLAVKLPYTGKQVDISSILKQLGFREDFNLVDNTVSYKSGELVVEFVKDRKGSKAPNYDNPYIKELGIAPQSLPYLKILLENKITLNIRDLGKVALPSLPAFLIHKLLVAMERQDQAKKNKDYQQAVSVAKAVLKDQKYMEEIHNILNSINKSWQKKVSISADNASNHVDDGNLLKNLF